jgi:DNA-binding XRE family transcriptional regulator
MAGAVNAAQRVARQAEIVRAVMAERAASLRHKPPATPSADAPTAARLDWSISSLIKGGRRSFPSNPELPSSAVLPKRSPTVETYTELRERRRRTVAANIVRIRKDRGISQRRLAEQLGIKQTYLSDVERAIHEPVTYVDRIAAILGVTVDELYFEDAA